MTTCAIIIYSFESLHFLRANIRQIRKYAHPEIEQHIYVSEQSSEEGYRQVLKEFGKDADVTIVRMKAICSGYSIDYIMRYAGITAEFICTLDVDAFPIHKNWLYTSIKLLQEENFSFVGVHADIENVYSKYGRFFCMAQYFRVGCREDFMLLSLQAGFTRFTHRWQIGKLFSFINNDWEARARELKEDGWSDSSVTAHCWEDQHTNHHKFAFAVTHCIGIEGQEPLFGRLTDDIVFHFGFSFTSIGSEKHMGERYLNWTRRIKEDFSDELIAEMLASIKPLQSPIPREVWDGERKMITAPTEDLNQKINQLKCNITLRTL